MRRSLADMLSAEEEEQFELELAAARFPVSRFFCFPVLDCFGDEDVRQVRLMSEVVSVAGSACGGGSGGSGAGAANSWSDCGVGVDFLSAEEKQS